MVRRRGGYINAKSLSTIDRSNSSFAEYYKNQLQLTDEDFNDFLSSLKEDLPATFRITGFREQSKELLNLLKENYLHNLINDSSLNENTEFSVTPLKWYPKEMAWQINASRLSIRKSPELKTLQGFLVSESESGNISRQEAVSMLPPLVLNIKEHHRVLDLCAAPGSKSAQLVELMHADAEGKSQVTGYAEPSGIVIANDIDRKRCYMMVHQVKRLQSPCVIFTEEDVSVYPRVFVSSEINKNEKTKLLFDRILADVPCSGDGTLRKSPDIWKRWTPKIGRGHHGLQKRILRRGLELLRTPSSPNEEDLPRLVYSTCSFNPVENEAVVAAILSACDGAVRLVPPDLLTLKSSDNSSHATGFIARPGLQSWQVLLGSDKWYSSLEEVPERDRGSLLASLFPPTNAEDLHLEHCRRVLPHDQNTGGFFVAVMEKVSELPWMGGRLLTIKKTIAEPGENNQSLANNDTKSQSGPEAKRSRREESGFVYFNPKTDLDWPSIRDYYGIEEFTGGSSEVVNNGAIVCHRLHADQLLYRPSALESVRRRNIYYTNCLVKRVLQANEHPGLHIISGGVRLFAACEDKQFSGYRLLHDGVYLANAFLPRSPSSAPLLSIAPCHRRIVLTRDQHKDLLLLLREEMPLVERMTDATKAQCAALTVGPVLIEYIPQVPARDESIGEVALPRCTIAFAGWRGLMSLRHYIDRHERMHILRLCGLDCSIPVVMGKQVSAEGSDNLTAIGDTAKTFAIADVADT